MLKLLPLTYTEIIGQPDAPFAWEELREELKEKRPPCSPDALWNMLLRGFYPELSENREKDALLWRTSYVQTYLERDVRNLKQIGDLTQFQLFLRAVANRSAQLFHISDVARDIGISVNTVKSWLSILEATYQIIILRPYFNNCNKRLVKTPKVYFTDVGTLCYLTGLKDPGHLAAGPLAGALFETFVFSEIYKRLVNRGIDPQLYFWRTAVGVEVDLLVQEDTHLIPIEVKATATPKPLMAAEISSLQKDLSNRLKPGYVVHLGATSLPLAHQITSLPVAML